MEMLINRTTMEEKKARARRNTRIFRCLAGAALAAFVLACALTRTGNARAMLIGMMAGMTLAGWAGIWLYTGKVLPARAEARHLQTLLEGEPETFEGVFFPADYTLKIPKSVRVRPVTLETEEKPLRLNLDGSFSAKAPAAGSRVRVQAVSGYITGIEVLEAGEGEARPLRAPGKARTFFRRLWALLPGLVLWAMGVVIIGGFVMNLITDTSPERKISIFADCGVRNGAALAEALETDLAEPVRMVKVHPFDYAMFGNAEIDRADLYIVPASRAGEYRAWFAPLPEGLREGGDRLEMDGVPYGIPVAGPEGTGICAEYFAWESGETYYLFFGNGSAHLAGNPGAVNNQAEETARKLLAVP